MIEKSAQNQNFDKILEIGSGQGHHLQFVKRNFHSYEMIDIESNEAKSRVPIELLSKVNFTLGDARDLPFSDDVFDRALCTCVLLHINDVEKVFKELRRTSKNNALLTLYIPCDPGLGYRFIRHFTSHVKQCKELKIEMKDTKYLWALEHPNHYPGVIAKIKYVFKEDQIKIKRFPFPFFSWNANLFSIVKVIVKK